MKLPHIGFYERALFSFWRSAGMAFLLAGRSLVPALPFLLLSVLASLLPSWQLGAFAGLESYEVKSVVETVALALRAVCYLVIFCLTLQQAQLAFLPESQDRLFSRDTELLPLVKAMALYFVKTFAGVLVISFLLAYLVSGPFVAFFQVLAESHNPVAALWSFAWHFALEIINPWMWALGFIASRYFIIAAGHSIDVFNAFLKASEVEIRHVGALLAMVKKERRYFISLVAVPHVLFGIFSAALAAFAPQFSYAALMGVAIDLKDGLPNALLNAAAINFYFAASVAVVAGFIAIIWFAAARRTADIVSDKVEDIYGRKLFG